MEREGVGEELWQFVCGCEGAGSCQECVVAGCVPGVGVVTGAGGVVVFAPVLGKSLGGVLRGSCGGDLGRCGCRGLGLCFELLELLACFPGGERGEVEYRNIVGLGDADPHRGTAFQFATACPADDGLDRGVEVGAKKYGDVSGVELWCRAFALMPCGVKRGGHVVCGLLAVRGEGMGAWVILVLVVGGPRQEDVALVGTRALGERGVGAVRAAAVQMPALAVEPLGHGLHDVENRRWGLA